MTSKYHQPKSISALGNPVISLAPLFISIVLMAMLPGCAGIPGGSPEMKRQALSFSPPPGQAGIYVIRTGNIIGGAIEDEINLDFQSFGAVAPKSFLFGYVSPGKHALRFHQGKMGGMLGALSWPANSSAAQGQAFAVVYFTAEAGTNYYFRVTLNDPPFVQLSTSEGQDYARKYKLSGLNRFQEMK